MSVGEKPTVAFTLALISGILVLLGGLARMMWAWTPFWGGMMGPGMMGMWMPWFGYTFSAIGLVSGLVILVGGLMLQSRPDQAQTWGVLILVFAVVSLFSMGGFLAGAILGIVAGILALTYRPAQR